MKLDYKVYPGQVVDLEGAREITGLSARTLCKYSKLGLLPRVKKGKHIYYKITDLVRFFSEA